MLSGCVNRDGFVPMTTSSTRVLIVRHSPCRHNRARDGDNRKRVERSGLVVARVVSDRSDDAFAVFDTALIDHVLEHVAVVFRAWDGSASPRRSDRRAHGGHMGPMGSAQARCTRRDRRARDRRSARRGRRAAARISRSSPVWMVWMVTEMAHTCQLKNPPHYGGWRESYR